MVQVVPTSSMQAVAVTLTFTRSGNRREGVCFTHDEGYMV